MKRALIVLTVFTLIPITSFAKRIIAAPPVPQYRYAVKFYNTISYSETQNSPFSTKQNFLHPSVAFNWKTKNNNFREIELNSFQLGRITENQYAPNASTVVTYMQIKTTNISVRYEYILHIAKRKQWKLNPMLGFAANPYYEKQQTRLDFPSSLGGGQATVSHVGARAYVVPRLNYNISNRLFLDLNIPVCLMDIGINSTESISSSMSSKNSTADFLAVPTQLSARLGIGIRL